MPVVGIPLDELHRFIGAALPRAELEDELHRFGCSVEEWATVQRFRCPGCSALVEALEHEPPPPTCEVCGADLRDREPEPVGKVEVLRMELLAVRPDLFDPAGLGRALRGFLGREQGAPRYHLETGDWSVEVDDALAGPEVHRPRIAVATVHGVELDEARLRSLMKLQENIHWALGRDRKLASIGVYDLAHVTGPTLRYRAAARDELRFVPLGFDPADPDAALNPDEILARHPKGVAFARLLAGCAKVPLLQDAAGGVLSMPPIINSEPTRVTTASRDLLVDVTGLADRHVDRALNIVVTSLLEVCPEAHARTVDIRYAGESRRTPDLTPEEILVDPAAASRLIGVEWTPDELAGLLARMRHDARVEGDQVRVMVPGWRADVLHPRDLTEDAAIAHGYDRLPGAELTRATYGMPHPREQRAGRARAALVGQGFLEVMTLALTSEVASFERTGLADEDRHVRLENPISVEQTMVRISTLPGLMETLAINLTRPYPQRIFEVGLVAEVDPEAETGARERLVAGLALAGDRLGYADIRAAVDALLRDLGAGAVAIEPYDRELFLPGRGARLVRGGVGVGRLGEVHPAVLERFRIVHPVAVAEIDLGRL